MTACTARRRGGLGQGCRGSRQSPARKGRAGSTACGLPRSDLHVTLDGVEIKPALALGSWLAFRPTSGTGMAMGDLVLTENEINPVMKKLAEGGIEITALHNHLLRAQPATFYMHVRDTAIRSGWPPRCMTVSR